MKYYFNSNRPDFTSVNTYLCLKCITFTVSSAKLEHEKYYTKQRIHATAKMQMEKCKTIKTVIGFNLNNK